MKYCGTIEAGRPTTRLKKALTAALKKLKTIRKTYTIQAWSWRRNKWLLCRPWFCVAIWRLRLQSSINATAKHCFSDWLCWLKVEQGQITSTLKVTNILKFKHHSSLPEIQLHTSLYVLTEKTVFYLYSYTFDCWCFIDLTLMLLLGGFYPPRRTYCPVALKPLRIVTKAFVTFLEYMWAKKCWKN